MSEDQTSDAHLVERARMGDRAAFEVLVRRHLRGVYAVALAELADTQDAEDALQDTFILALERLEECRDGGRFGAWVRTIARNRSRSLGRRGRVRVTAPLESAVAASDGSNPALDAERAQLRQRLEDALEGLTNVQRTVVLMHDLEGFRHREIALELDIPEGTVRSHLFFARKALRTRLGDLYHSENVDDSTH